MQACCEGGATAQSCSGDAQHLRRRQQKKGRLLMPKTQLTMATTFTT